MRKKQPPRSSGDYRIGKGRPPEASRYRPGQSGNLRGRPRGSKNAGTRAKDELKRQVIVTIGGKKRKMSVADIAYRRLGDKAMSGDQKALGFLLMLANQLDPAEAAAVESPTISEEDLDALADYFRRTGPKGHDARKNET
jgi:hypothetical protein